WLDHPADLVPRRTATGRNPGPHRPIPPRRHRRDHAHRRVRPVQACRNGCPRLPIAHRPRRNRHTTNLFRSSAMMNSDTTPTVNQAPVSAANTTGDQVSRFGAECPIRVGDEVTGRDNPTWRGRVRSIYLNDEVAECAIETADGRRGFAPPWALVPADTEPSREWRGRMQTLKQAQRHR